MYMYLQSPLILSTWPQFTCRSPGSLGLLKCMRIPLVRRQASYISIQRSRKIAVLFRYFQTEKWISQSVEK